MHITYWLHAHCSQVLLPVILATRDAIAAETGVRVLLELINSS